MAEAAAKLTYEDYCRIPDDGKRHEIIDGVHYVSPSPTDKHQAGCVGLACALQDYLKRSKRGKLRIGPYDVLLDEHSVVVPDLVVILAAHRERMRTNGCHGPPDLVVEILSPSNRSHDVVKKRRLYARCGVPEYWIVDPAVDRVEVYRSEAGVYGPPRLLTAEAGDRVETPLLPGFSIPVAENFADAIDASVE